MEAVNVVWALLDLILELVPHTTARTLLDDAASRRAEAIADAAEEAKLVATQKA